MIFPHFIEEESRLREGKGPAQGHTAHLLGLEPGAMALGVRPALSPLQLSPPYGKRPFAAAPEAPCFCPTPQCLSLLSVFPRVLSSPFPGDFSAVELVLSATAQGEWPG